MTNKKFLWFRMYNEARNDAKLRALSDAQFRVWFGLLCYASEGEERGVIAVEREVLAVEVANGDAELLAATLERLEKLRMVAVSETRIEFLHFVARQYDHNSDQPEAVAQRVRKTRKTHKEPTVTNCNDQETTGNEYTNTNTNTNTGENPSPAVPENADSIPALPALLAGERFPLTRELALYSEREFAKPLFDPAGVQVRLAEQYEAKLAELAELAVAVQGRAVLAPIDDRCLQEYWRNQLLRGTTPYTSGVMGRLLSQAVKDLAERKAQGRQSARPPSAQPRFDMAAEQLPPERVIPREFREEALHAAR